MEDVAISSSVADKNSANVGLDVGTNQGNINDPTTTWVLIQLPSELSIETSTSIN